METAPAKPAPQTDGVAAHSPAPVPQTCRNCGRTLFGKFCADCGQEAAHHVLPLGDLLHDLLDEFLKWDGRLVATLKPLFLRPGFLTTEYLAGKRASYISPLRLYFIISTIYFLAFSYHGAEQLLKTSNLPPKSPAAAAPQAPAQPAVRSVREKVADEGPFLAEKIPTITIFLIPVLAGVLALFYRRSKRFYVEHLVFMLHVNAFAFLVSLPAILAPQVLAWTVMINVFLVPIYMFAALRRVYGQGPGKTLAKVVLFTAAELLIVFCTDIGITIYFVARSKM